MGYELGTQRRISGVVIGVVSDNVHPEGHYAVKLVFPWISSSDCGDDDDFPSTWCPVSTPMAGEARGFYALPEVGDEVVVSFFHGDMRFPVVIGSLWNDESPAPVKPNAVPELTDPDGNAVGLADCLVDNDAAGGDNNARFWISRSGNGIVFDDTEGKERTSIFSADDSFLVFNDEKQTMTIQDGWGETYIQFDATNKKITMECADGDIDILCKNGTFKVEAKDIETIAEKTQVHEAGTTWKAESGGKWDIDAGGTLTINAPKIDLNP